MEWILQEAQGFWVWLQGLSSFGQILLTLLSIAVILYIFFMAMNRFRRWATEHHILWVPLMLVVFIIAASWFFWKPLMMIKPDVMRNLILLTAGIVGWYFLYQRVKTADQSKKAAEQSAQTAEKGLTTERLTRAIEQLAHEKISICLGGIRSLEQIAKSHEEEREKIIEILSTRIHEIAPLDARKETREWFQGLEDIEEQNRLINEKRYKRLDVEIIAKVLGDIMRIHPCYFYKLYRIDLSGLIFRESNFTDCFFSEVNMSYTNFVDVDFCNTKLYRSNISCASFVEPKNLTQEQINQSFYYKGHPPLFLSSDSSELQPPEEWDFPQRG